MNSEVSNYKLTSQTDLKKKLAGRVWRRIADMSSTDPLYILIVTKDPHHLYLDIRGQCFS